jgi:choline-glycine betaine transporter
MGENSTENSVDALKSSLVHFGFADYSVFIAMLICCTIVGLYFGYEDYKRRKTNRKHRRGSEEQGLLLF